MKTQCPVKPKRSSKRWLDEDCPDGVLCIFRFDYTVEVIYSEIKESNGHYFMSGREMSEGYFTLKVYQVSQYRFANKHRYAKWSSLTDQQKEYVKQDLKEMNNEN